MKLYIILICLLSLTYANMHIRLDDGMVLPRIVRFWKDQDISQCFERLDTPSNELVLKCLYNNELYDVVMHIERASVYI